MQNSSSSVRVARDPRPEDAYRNPYEGQESEVEGTKSPDELLYRRRARRGALYGAGLGFMVGMIPLIMSTMMGAVAGLMIAKASRIRVDRVNPPSIHFASHPKSTAAK
jgi:hypothetical protein